MTTKQESPARATPEPNRQPEEKREHKPRYVTSIGGHVSVSDFPCGCSVPWDLFDEAMTRDETAEEADVCLRAPGGKRAGGS